MTEHDTIPAPPPESEMMLDIRRAIVEIDRLCGDTRNYGLQNNVRQHLQIILANAEMLAEGER